MKTVKTVKILSALPLLILSACNGGGATVSSEPVAITQVVPEIEVTVSSTPDPVVSPSPSVSPSPAPSASPSPAPSPVPYTYSGGTGTIGDPWQLYTADDVQHINDNLGAYFQLERNIDMAGFSFTQLGAFSGTLYGNNYELTNLTIARNDTTTAALFSSISGTVVQLKLYNARVSGLGYAAIMTGSLTGLISACHIHGTVTSPSGGNGYNTGVGNPMYVNKSGGGWVTISTTVMNVQFNGGRVSNPDRL